LQARAPIVIVDIAGPLIVYYTLSGKGFSTLDALILSGILPAFGIGLAVLRHRRLDAIGTLVLVGIVVGTLAGLASGSARFVLLDGTIPTAVFGVLCLGSLWSSRPLTFRLALETIGAETPKGRAFADEWRYEGFRHAFRVTTVVWGLAFLAEAALQAVIVEVALSDTAKTTSNLLPLVFAACVIAWNVWYTKRGQRQGARAEAAARARGDTPRTCPPRRSKEHDRRMHSGPASGVGSLINRWPALLGTCEPMFTAAGSQSRACHLTTAPRETNVRPGRPQHPITAQTAVGC